MVICLERGADLHMAQLMPLPLTVSCFSKIQIGFIFLVPAHPGSPGKRAVKRYVCYCKKQERIKTTKRVQNKSASMPRLAFAAAAPCCWVPSISQPAEPTAANPTHAAAAIDSWDRQTDRRTDTVPLHRPSRILCRAV